MYYYLDHRNEVIGAWPLDDLRALLAAGTITEATLVCAEGDGQWFALHEWLAVWPPATPEGDSPRQEPEAWPPPSDRTFDDHAEPVASMTAPVEEVFHPASAPQGPSSKVLAGALVVFILAISGSFALGGWYGATHRPPEARMARATPVPPLPATIAPPTMASFVQQSTPPPLRVKEPAEASFPIPTPIPPPSAEQVAAEEAASLPKPVKAKKPDASPRQATDHAAPSFR